MVTYPLPIEYYQHPDYKHNCRWCGEPFTDKRRRFCNKEHEQLWLANVYYPEKFWWTRTKALERDEYKCTECGLTNEESIQKFGRGLHVHHIIPRVEGGSHRLENLRTLCEACHIAIHKNLSN
jgi:5-methylcytosine-specific restriction endonuclease McrA